MAERNRTYPKCLSAISASSATGLDRKLTQWLVFLVCALSVVFITPLSTHADIPLAGDIAPRGTPDGKIDLADFLLLQRFILGDLTPTPEERLAADVAPLGSPDSELNVGDLVVLYRAIMGEIVLPPIASNESPSPVAPDLITVTDTGGGTVLVSGDAGSVAPGTTVILTNLETGAISITSATSGGSFGANLAATTGQVFSIVVTDASGNQSMPTNISVGEIFTLTIDTPMNGSVIAGSVVDVSGTFYGPPNSAVTVNGVTACVSGNRFYASAVPLATGNNILLAMAGMADGVTTSRQISVTSSGPAAFEVRPDPACGHAPQPVRFIVMETGTAKVQSIEIDVDNDGAVDIVADASTVPEHTYPATGVFQPRIRIYDNQGASHDSMHTIIVNDLSDLDTMLRGIYASFLDRLRAGAIQGALNHLNDPMRTKFAPLFDEIRADLPVLVDQIGTLTGGGVAGDIAYYTIVREENGTMVGFPLYMVRDADGVWRIGDM